MTDTSYLSRTIQLPATLATQVFAVCRADRLRHSPDPGWWSVATTGGAMLRLDRGTPRTGMYLHSCRGVARLGRTRRVRIDLELNRWSRDMCELGVLFGRSAVSPRLHEAVGVTLDALADEVELRGLLAVQPEHETAVAALL